MTKIMDITPPKTKKHIQPLLGLINYYAKFIPCFAEESFIPVIFAEKKKNKMVVKLSDYRVAKKSWTT